MIVATVSYLWHVVALGSALCPTYNETKTQIYTTHHYHRPTRHRIIPRIESVSHGIPPPETLREWLYSVLFDDPRMCVSVQGS
ncbi:hypothetical protein F5141DRAFT_1148274 [Pisolithus sp. B1]|nr:hypothetical protein F5141DRAFT_1148274 [Pisolithus sp. B1]